MGSLPATTLENNEKFRPSERAENGFAGGWRSNGNWIPTLSTCNTLKLLIADFSPASCARRPHAAPLQTTNWALPRLDGPAGPLARAVQGSARPGRQQFSSLEQLAPYRTSTHSGRRCDPTCAWATLSPFPETVARKVLGSFLITPYETAAPAGGGRGTCITPRRCSVHRTSGERNGYSNIADVEADETSRLIASNKVEGTAVYNREGERLGSVYNFMVDKMSGQVAYAVMSFGGFLGIGDSYHPLPWKNLHYDTTAGGYVVDLDRWRSKTPHVTKRTKTPGRTTTTVVRSTTTMSSYRY